MRKPVITTRTTFFSTHRTGTVCELHTPEEITAALGIEPTHNPHDDGKVTLCWDFFIDGKPCAIWDYYEARWSCYDPDDKLAAFFNTTPGRRR